jgi:Flp pilus assembly protein TadD
MTTASVPAMARRRFPVWLVAVLLALVTIPLYWPATGYDFVNFDDDVYVTDNTHVTSGFTWENVTWAFRSGHAANWHPVTWLSHMLDCQLFGLRPGGHHLTSVLLHACNAVLVFLLLQQLTRTVWRSLFVATLFAVHPLRVESVAWVAERKDVLSACFGLLALMFYGRYALKSEVGSQKSERGGKPLDSCLRSSSYWFSLLFFALGLMSKPMLVTWPFVMLLLDYWPLKRFNRIPPRRLFAEKIPLFALAMAAGVVTFVMQEGGGTVAEVKDLPLGARIENALISYCRYLGKLFWPTDLAVFYPHPGYWPLGKVLLAGGLILGISVLLFLQRRRSRFSLMGWLWFCGILVPVIGLVQVGSQAMADRYTYIATIGIMVALVWGLHGLTTDGRPQRIGLLAAGLATIVFCVVTTRQQLGHWQNSETLFRHALDVTKDNYLAHYNLAIALDKKGQTDDAIRQYQETIRVKPDQTVAHYNLGVALDKTGQIDDAIRQYEEAIRLKPDRAETHNGLGIALDKKGRVDDAIRQYQEALRLKPAYAEARNNLGIALDHKGQIGEAIGQYLEAIRVKPDYGEAHNNLGTDFFQQGRTGEAILQYQEALRLKPGYAEAHNNLGLAFNKAGRIDEAIRQFQEALKFRPNYAEARQNLDAVLATRADSSKPQGDSTNP